MEQLCQRGAYLGLTTSEIDQALTLGRPSQELGWIEGRGLGSQALSIAKELFEEERILEYECYDSTWHSQGRAVITLKKWEVSTAGLFSGTHGPSFSDGSYAWFAEHQMGLEKGLCRICDCE